MSPTVVEPLKLSSHWFIINVKIFDDLFRMATDCAATNEGDGRLAPFDNRRTTQSRFGCSDLRSLCRSGNPKGCAIAGIGLLKDHYVHSGLESALAKMSGWAMKGKISDVHEFQIKRADLQERSANGAFPSIARAVAFSFAFHLRPMNAFLSEGLLRSELSLQLYQNRGL
jgi:hypothetical protein